MDNFDTADTTVLIQGGLILTMGGTADEAPFYGDILITNGTITSIGSGINAPEGAEVIPAEGRLIMPGLVNAHTHSSETFFKGRYEGLPLELWLLYAYPLLMGPLLPPRMLYLRSLLLAMESLKSGVTLMCDDFFDPPSHDHDRLAMVFKAYEDVGIRANVASAVMNIHTLDALPYARDLVPQNVQDQLNFGPMISAGTYIDYCKGAFDRFHQTDGRLRFMIAPSAPQRCTPDLLQACSELAQDRGVPLHSHVLETKTQAVTGPEFYGKTLIGYLDDLGVLTSSLTIAHSVWVDDADIELMGASGCAVAHNAISNLKLGAGIAPIRKLLKAGVPVALGTDGVCSNDTARIFDVMRVAALVQSGTGPAYQDWLTAAETLTAATIDGARSAALGDVTGSLEVGKRADILVLRLDSYAFTPLNDVRKQLVYAENGSSIERVIVDGVTVVKDNALTTVNEAEILAEIRDAMPTYLAQHTEIEARNSVFHEHFAAIHQKATGQEIGFSRYWAPANSTP